MGSTLAVSMSTDCRQPAAGYGCPRMPYCLLHTRGLSQGLLGRGHRCAFSGESPFRVPCGNGGTHDGMVAVSNRCFLLAVQGGENGVKEKLSGCLD